MPKQTKAPKTEGMTEEAIMPQEDKMSVLKREIEADIQARITVCSKEINESCTRNNCVLFPIAHTSQKGTEFEIKIMAKQSE